MNGQNDDLDHELRDLLGKVGQDAERRAPPFLRTWSAVRRARQNGMTPVWHPRLGWALAVVLVVASVGAGLFWQRLQPGVVRVASIEPGSSALTEALTAGPADRMPTDFLLSPGDENPPVSVAQLANEITELLRP